MLTSWSSSSSWSCSYALSLALLFSVLALLQPSHQTSARSRGFNATATGDKVGRNKESGGRFLGLFNIVKFENEACSGSSSDGTTGICLTEQQCADKGGVAMGTCASG